MNSVFLLWHIREAETANANSKLIGVYESRAAAIGAQTRSVLQPGFFDFPNDFHVDEYVVGKDHWTEGFIT